MPNIIVLGTRGIPGIPGGVETHCEHLYPRLVDLGCRVTLIRRTPYVSEDNKRNSHNGVGLVDLFAPRTKSLEAIAHTLIGVLYARIKSPDILHIHAIGPSLAVPLARLLGLRVVVTNHGPDYDRQKWGRFGKFILRLGERLGCRYANAIIVISEVIKRAIEKNYSRDDCHLIFNGVTLPDRSPADDYIRSLGLSRKKYIIAVGRFVEEKGFHDLIEAYSGIDAPACRLVIVGDADHETSYSRSIKEKARKTGIVLTGYIMGEELRQIFTHARLFVMPSYHEGLPIALLEAMSYNLDVLASDIPANLEVRLDGADYFTTGDVKELASKIELKLGRESRVDFRGKIEEKYCWDKIAKQTLEVYEKTCRKWRG